jgi:hypothetical protein
VFNQRVGPLEKDVGFLGKFASGFFSVIGVVEANTEYVCGLRRWKKEHFT